MNEQKMQYFKNNYRIFGLGSIIYGILYAILLYKNPEAITFPIIIAVTLGICAYVLKKFRVPIKKEGYFLIAVIQLLAIAVCLTESHKLIIYNKIGIFLLLFIFMMEQMYDTKGWQVGKNISKLFIRMVNVLAYYGKPWRHLASFVMGKEEQNNKNRKYIAIGIAVSIPLVLLICGLLANADRVFESFFDWIFKNILSADAILIIIVIIAVYSLMYSFICSSVTMEEDDMEEDDSESKKFPAIVAITFTTIVAIIYISFCVLQISYLFSGYSDGLTYSQFAREGFFELLFVSAINLAMVVTCTELFEKSKALDIVMIIISACTYILIGSSAYRMVLYIEAYELTFLRVFVLWFLAVLSIWMTGAIIYIKKRNWNYFKFSVSVIAVMYLIFVYINPDSIIIKYNIAHAKEITAEDIDYFCDELEPRVVLPEIKNMREKFASDDKDQIEILLLGYLERIVRKNRNTSFREMNFAKRQAYSQVEEAFDELGSIILVR